MKKRTQIDYSQHELHIVDNDHVKIHHLKMPKSNHHNVKFINCGGIMAVTGDFGNWIFCREFHPGPKEGASEGYWEEKLRILSSQDPYEIDWDATEREIDRLLKEEEDLTEEEIEYLEGLKREIGEAEWRYLSYAFNEGVGRFNDYEYVPTPVKQLKFWLKAVYDAFDEICSRLKDEA